MGAFPPWVIGSALAIGAAIAINLGMDLMKLSHSKNSELPVEEQQRYFCRKLWLFGFAVFMLGEGLNFVSMSFASQTLLAVLGCFSPLSNVFLAPWLLGEPVRRADLASLPFIIGGSILVVFYSDHSSQDYTLRELVALYRQPVFVVFAVILLGALAGCIIYVHGIHRFVQHQCFARKSPREGSDTALKSLLSPRDGDAQFAGLDSVRVGVLRRGSSDSNHSIQGEDPDGGLTGLKRGGGTGSAGSGVGDVESQPPQRFCCCACCDEYRVRSPMVCTLIGSILGAVGFMFARSFSLLIKESIQGTDQFKDPVCVFIMLVFAASGVGRIHYINEALNDGHAMLVVPTYFVLSTVFVIAGGLTYFKEYESITSAGMGLAFAGGVAITLFGVVIIAFFGAGRADLGVDDVIVSPSPVVARSASFGSRARAGSKEAPAMPRSKSVDVLASGAVLSSSPPGDGIGTGNSGVHQLHPPLPPHPLHIRVPPAPLTGYSTFSESPLVRHSSARSLRSGVPAVDNMVRWLGTPVSGAEGASQPHNPSSDLVFTHRSYSHLSAGGGDTPGSTSPHTQRRRQASAMSLTGLTTPLW